MGRPFLRPDVARWTLVALAALAALAAAAAGGGYVVHVGRRAEELRR
jgi:hypothetical protein